MGHLGGAIKQFRGPLCSHLRVFRNHATLHRDAIDPRVDPVGHMFVDASDDLVGLAVGAAVGYAAAKFVYKERRDVSKTAILESIFVGAVVGTCGYFVGKSVTRWIQGK